MHAMWKPQKFKVIYLIATIYVLTLTLPSASAVYWAFGDALLTHSNALALLPKTRFRDAAVILMLIHQVAQHLFFSLLTYKKILFVRKLTKHNFSITSVQLTVLHYMRLYQCAPGRDVTNIIKKILDPDETVADCQAD